MNKEFLKKCWQHPRWHSLMVLILWIVALSFLMGIVSLMSLFNTPKTTTYPPIEPKEEETTYLDKLNTLIEEDYDFVFTITKQDGIIIFEGSQKDEIITGYRRDNHGTMKYKIENNIPYEIFVDNIMETDQLYEGVNASCLTIKALVEQIVEVPEENVTIKEEEEYSKYIYNLLLEEKTYKTTITESENQIEEITLENEEETIHLQFTNIK